MAGKKNVFVVVPLPDDCVERIEKVDPRLNVIFDKTLIPKQRYVADRKGEPRSFTKEMEERWLSYLREAEVMFGFDTRHMSDFAQLAPHLKWVQGTSTGIGPVVAQHRWADLGITTTSASGIHSVPIAEFVTMALLCFTKGMLLMQRQKADKIFERYCTGQLRGKTLGVIGLGNVGTEVARQASALGMRVLGTKRNTSGSRPQLHHVDRIFAPSDLRLMLPECDFVAATVPATRETFHLLDASMLAAMKPGAILINVSRGATIDESELIRALHSGHLGGAALDVFETEPLPPESPLWTMSNVIICPHSASCAEHEDVNITELFIDNLQRYLDGRPLRNVIRPDLMY
jgi:glyoxylate/hydroxypyruvate reductase